MKDPNDTDTGDFYTPRRHPQRRSTDGALNSLAESALLKILQYVITAFAIPIITWSINNVANRLADLEKTLNRHDTINATYGLRVSNLETLSVEHTSTQRLMSERLLILEQEMRALQRINGK